MAHVGFDKTDCDDMSRIARNPVTDRFLEPMALGITGFTPFLEHFDELVPAFFQIDRNQGRTRESVC